MTLAVSSGACWNQMFLDVVYRVEWFSQESIVTSHATWCDILTAATAQIDWAACIKVCDTCQHFTRVVALKMGVHIPFVFASLLQL
mmetsp:Transcript_23875/g.38889  ORF Transcript_23875/g.38889 Transcript_23875/m.38889 type:complete len:86 (-) Transcript_23875:267-524(-)